MKNTLSELKVEAVEGAFVVVVATNCLTVHGWSVAFVRQYSLHSVLGKELNKVNFVITLYK